MRVMMGCQPLVGCQLKKQSTVCTQKSKKPELQMTATDTLRLISWL